MPISAEPCSAEEITVRLAQDLPQWRYEDGQLCRGYKTGTWPQTLMLLNAIGYLAEKDDHHPELHASYGRLEVRLITYSARAVTEKGISLAIKIEALAL